jgi:hypothetical protein
MDDFDLYCNLMEEVKKRTIVLQGFLDGKINAIYPATTIECASLQLRKILELIALGSLVAHKKEYAKNYKNFASHWHAERILSDIEKINPGFYPKPIREVPSIRPGFKTDLTDIKDGFLTKNDFISTYSALGDILHAKNPFALQTDYRRSKDLIKEALGKTIVLLDTHQIQLFNSPNFLLVHMNEDRDDRVHAYVFGPKSNETGPRDT